MDMNKLVVFIPVSDMDTYADWDDGMGYGGQDQVNLDTGIIVSVEREADFRKNVAQFEEWNN